MSVVSPVLPRVFVIQSLRGQQQSGKDVRMVESERFCPLLFQSEQYVSKEIDARV